MYDCFVLNIQEYCYGYQANTDCVGLPEEGWLYLVNCILFFLIPVIFVYIMAVKRHCCTWIYTWNGSQ